MAHLSVHGRCFPCRSLTYISRLYCWCLLVLVALVVSRRSSPVCLRAALHLRACRLGRALKIWGERLRVLTPSPRPNGGRGRDVRRRLCSQGLPERRARAAHVLLLRRLLPTGGVLRHGRARVSRHAGAWLFPFV